ncbi:MAG TPA: MAPEG family protein [Burkholderiaceae bacterium]|nr:MAPEG family protein [Burkholderiaceae bacterium]
MKWTAWATLAALAVYFWTVVNAARARVKYKVTAPSMEGPLQFQSAQRVQVNTVEQLVLFLPALWLCAYLLGDRWAALGGAVWVVGRVLYARAYYQNPGRRAPGFILTLLSSVALALGAAAGLLLR